MCHSCSFNNHQLLANLVSSVPPNRRVTEYATPKYASWHKGYLEMIILRNRCKKVSENKSGVALF